MPQTALEPLEHTLRDLPRVGTLVKDRGYRQVWRFEHGGRAFYLKFYPRAGGRDWWRRLFRGSPAMREFLRLQWLQKAEIPAPRAAAFLGGFALDGRAGDAVILDAIEPSVPLDEFLNARELDGRPVPEHRALAGQVIALVHALGKAGLGHDDLHLGNFLLSGETVYLIDAYAVRRGGLRRADVLHLGASVRRFATTADLVRGWRRLTGGASNGGDAESERPPPEYNAVSRKLWRAAAAPARGGNRYVGRLSIGDWRGVFFRQTKHPRRWAPASRLTVTDDDWRAAWPDLLARMEGDALTLLKQSPSGDVMAGEVVLDGETVPIILKRPRRRYWYRYLNEVGRGTRPRRAWFKAWGLIVRDLPTAWPLAVMERRRAGYVVDCVLICERVAGETLWGTNFDAMDPAARDLLFRRTGRLLRRIDRTGLSHFDAKASNYIVRDDPTAGPSPVLIDVDGVRRRRWVALGIQRLLRSMKQKRQYTPADSLALCQGYAPHARMEPEDDSPADDVAAPDVPVAEDSPTP